MMGIGGAPVGQIPVGGPAAPLVNPVAQPFGDVVAPPPVAPTAAAPGIGDAIATFMSSRQDRDKAAASEKARRQALFGSLGDLYG